MTVARGRKLWRPTAVGAIVERGDRAYVVSERPGPAWPVERTMPQTASAATSLLSRPLMLIAAAVGIVRAATVALWAHYGSGVLRNDRRRDCRLLVNARRSQRAPT
jgi:hypothetical protein